MQQEKHSVSLRTAAASEVSDSRASTAAARNCAASSSSFRAACTKKATLLEHQWQEPRMAACSDCICAFRVFCDALHLLHSSS